MSLQPKVNVLVGTRKGGFIFSSDADRQQWSVSDVMFKGWNVMHMVKDPRDGRLHAAVQHFVFGATTHYSDDLGQTWKQSPAPPRFTRPSASGRPGGTPEEAFSANGIPATPEEVLKVWNIEPGRADEPDVLYAGVQPASLFKSTDRGESWVLNESLYDHPQRGKWNPGAGGLCLHSIVLDPRDKNRMYVAVSAAGVYRTEDGGQTWQPRNKNVLADFGGDIYPEFGQCVHKLAIHPSQPDVLYQQNHCGVYRSDNCGDDWINLDQGKLPSRFGFPIVVHPHDPKTIYVMLEESDQFRMSVDGQAAVWRSRDAGESWQRITTGLPANAHVVVLREAMVADNLEPAGLYAGTDTGQLFYSRDDGDSWEIMADYLPPIQSVEIAIS
ncbi:MAG: exo-alpha-sialidase [Chloroflexi bacterium]|nr:exo-alpha-sialidase [Chloroflexota bacterium]